MEGTEALKPMASARLSVAVHPLVILNISDQYTRAKVQSTGRELKILGAIIGKQSGREVEVCNSFDLNFTEISDGVLVDVEYLELRQKQYEAVFKTLEIVGWYTVGSTEPGRREMSLLKQLTSFNENPILLKFNPTPHGSRQPVTVYESVIELAPAGGQPVVQFVEVSQTMAAEEAERICVDHVARLQSNDRTAESEVVGPLSAQHSAVKMLHSRVLLLLDYIKDVQDGHLDADLDILRSISSLCNRLPLMDSQELVESSNEQSRSVMLMAYLSSLTKNCAALNEVITKFNFCEERAPRRSRPYPQGPA